MSDEIINEPSVEQQIAEIRGDQDFFNNYSPRQRELVARLNTLVTEHPDATVPDGRTPSTKGAAVVAAREAAAKPDEERRRVEITTKLISGDLSPQERETLTRELRAIVNAQASPEEAAAIKDAPLSEHREFYGLRAPDERVLPKVNLEEFEREYSGHEQDFLLAAREHGLDARLVGDLRDAGIRMAIEAEGRPVSDEHWDATLKRFAGRLTKEQVASLRQWWKNSVEGGA